MGFTTEEGMVRVDIFREGGKWYETIAVHWEEYRSMQLRDRLKEYVRDQHRGRFEGCWAVCLHPYSEFEHPVMVKLDYEEN